MTTNVTSDEIKEATKIYLEYKDEITNGPQRRTAEILKLLEEIDGDVGVNELLKARGDIFDKRLTTGTVITLYSSLGEDSIDVYVKQTGVVGSELYRNHEGAMACRDVLSLLTMAEKLEKAVVTVEQIRETFWSQVKKIVEDAKNLESL